ncbi:MAG: right-handed parallel beta-helix repeat-containing protein, partial [Candidatus Heimdallarchaeota archaeon]|nr:right-handed parallel beta-helix repeat-containing protein [Candidatus Heimdallarchaeota archaeon]
MLFTNARPVLTLKMQDYTDHSFVIVTDDLVVHEPIIIIDDSNFTDYGFSGDGTKTTPYLIENWQIITNEDYSIHVKNTTKYFVIRDCHVEADLYAIGITDVANGTAIIYNNSCSGDGGILIDESDFSLITNNTCYEGNVGIVTYYSKNSIIFNNTCTTNYFDAIRTYYSTSSTIANNTFVDGGLTIIENYVEDYDTYLVENNTVNTKPVGYLVSEMDISFLNPSFGQLILIDCTNVTVSNQDFSNVGYGLYYVFCTNTTTTNNTFSYNTYGANFRQSIGYNIIEGNRFIENNDFAINLVGTDYVTLENNSIFSNGNGIRIGDSDYTILNNNSLIDNHNGIIILDGIYNNITNNLFQDNIDYAIHIDAISYGNLIYNNSFKDNNDGGIQCFDDGSVGNNTWYNSVTMKGNYWSDWSSVGNYTLDGAHGVADLYPLDYIP